MTQQELELPKGWVETEFKKTVKSIPLTGKKLKQKEIHPKNLSKDIFGVLKNLSKYVILYIE